MGQKAIRGPLTALVGLAVLALYFLGANEIVLLFASELAVMAGESLRRRRRIDLAGILALLGGLSLPALAATPFSLPLMFVTFLKIGTVLYGSGYVLLAFLRADFVIRLGWLTDRQLLDAIAIGQVTPGPVFTTATFIGYVLGSVPGALLATLGIFLPPFIFVALSNPLIPRLRNSPWASGMLDGVNVASLGLMAAVTWQLGWASLWLVLGGAVVGLVSAALR